MIAVYPGSFDPITLGHIDVIKRSLTMFDELVVAIASNTSKNALFTVDERKALCEQALSDLSGVRVEAFQGMTVRFAKACQSKVIVRGLRTVADFENEHAMALMNREMAPDIETVFITSAHDTSFISSRLVRETAQLGGDISSFVPAVVAQALSQKQAGPS